MNTFPAKLLLFGEYVLLQGASALAVPVPAFTASWRLRKHKNCPNRISKVFIHSVGLQTAGIDAQSLERDVAEGWCFESEIPIGYGLGSSGALCAAIYAKYAQNKSDDPALLKIQLGAMESYFHHSSSGIDPLCSYLNQPVLIQNINQVSILDFKPWPDAPVVFLIDTDLPRQTGPIMEWYLEQIQHSIFKSSLTEVLLPIHEQMLKAWLHGNKAVFEKRVSEVSYFQYFNMGPTIPGRFKDVWRNSFDVPGLTLKLCGAGGGGFLLGFAQHKTQALEFAAEHGLQLVFPFEPNPDGNHE